MPVLNMHSGNKGSASLISSIPARSGELDGDLELLIRTFSEQEEPYRLFELSTEEVQSSNSLSSLSRKGHQLKVPYGEALLFP